MTAGSTVGAKPKLLVIDDEPGIRRMILRILRDTYEGDEASDGPEALLKLEANNYGLVICDGVMPGMFGAQVYDQALRRLGAAAMPPWIFNSGGGCDFDALRQRAPLLEKPYTPADLLAVVRAVVEAGNG